jgi:hypothetical protein
MQDSNRTLLKPIGLFMYYFKHYEVVYEPEVVRLH